MTGKPFHPGFPKLANVVALACEERRLRLELHSKQANLDRKTMREWFGKVSLLLLAQSQGGQSIPKEVAYALCVLTGNLSAGRIDPAITLAAKEKGRRSASQMERADKQALVDYVALAKTDRHGRSHCRSDGSL